MGKWVGRWMVTLPIPRLSPIPHAVKGGTVIISSLSLQLKPAVLVVAVFRTHHIWMQTQVGAAPHCVCVCVGGCAGL